MMKILVSACLLGIPCRYDGKDNDNIHVHKLEEKHELIPFCPEVYGGLTTPREPAEIIDEKVVTSKGNNVTCQYMRGAKIALDICKHYGITTAVLKERSPSCGKNKIYDGTFSKTLTDGSGVCAKLLSDNGISIFGESEAEKLHSSLETEI